MVQFDTDVINSIWAPDPDSLQVNHGSFGRVPIDTIVLMHEYVDTEQANPQGWFRDVQQEVAKARAELATWIGADPALTGLVTNASAGMTIALNSLTEQQRGLKVVYTDHIYGAVEYAIHRAATRVGIVPVKVAVPLAADDDGVVAAVEAKLEGAAMLIIDQITSTTAKVMPVGRLAPLARERGVAVAVDGAHAPGLFAEPLAELADADFWVGNFHKWPCTPRGTAGLVVHPSLVDTVPLIASWSEQEDLPYRFDRQGTASYANWLAAPHAVALIEDRLGWQQVRDYGRALAAEAQTIVSATLGTTPPQVGQPAPTMRLVALPPDIAVDPVAAGALRDHIAVHYGVETAVTSFEGQGYIRISAHAYNTREDFVRLAQTLVEALG